MSTFDGVVAVCPFGKAIGGGFPSDSALTVLNGSGPASVEREWIIEVVYLGNTSATWVGYVVCMA